ncbi:MAG: tripartite tricarboxylate transporter TctB family protein [Rhodothermales bacterium]|nr:tripartite tricarboxylate transporter TctB family protein [Rhodothermales bacterium]
MNDESTCPGGSQNPTVVPEFLFILLLSAMTITALIVVREYHPVSALAPRVVLFPLLLVLLIQLFRLSRKYRANLRDKSATALESGIPAHAKRFLIFFSCACGFAVLMALVGYSLGSVIYMVVMMRVFGHCSLLKCLVISITASLSIYGLFVHMLDIQLNSGWVIDQLSDKLAATRTVSESVQVTIFSVEGIEGSTWTQ